MNQSERRPPAGKRRSVLLLLTVCLLLATGVALLGAGAALTAARVAVPTSGRTALHTGLVDAFYVAVNDALQSGDPAGLDALVAPDFLWCYPCPGAAQGRDGLMRYLATLRETAPAARLVAESAVAVSQDTVMARVRITGYPLVAEAVPWGPIEAFRLAGGLLVERRNHPDGLALIDPLLRTRLDPLPPAVTGLALARLAFAPGAGVDGLLSPGPTLLVVEAGELAVRAGRGASIVRAEGGAGERVPAGGSGGLDAVLRQGDAAIVPSGLRYALRQRGAAPAVALGVTLFFDEERSRHLSPRPPDVAPFFPANRSAAGPSPALLPPDVRFLASGAVAAWPPGPVSVALGRAILGPGAALAPSTGEEVLLAAEAGTLDMGGDEERTVAAGDGLMLPAGTEREFRNLGGGLLVLTLLTVAPAAA